MCYIMFRNLVTGLAFCAVAMFVTACGGGGGDSSSSDQASLIQSPLQASGGEAEELEVMALGFDSVDDAAWDQTAVRKVLHTFAYGGHASDAQIQTWAGMAPAAAIVEMLTFEEHNLKLSEPVAGDRDKLYTRRGTIGGLAEFLSSDSPDNGIPEGGRDFFNKGAPQMVPRTWELAVAARGLNPFRQKVGFWETNHHMVANLHKRGVQSNQVQHYYDDIMNAHAAGRPYEDIISLASLSAAITKQYGNHENIFSNGNCRCNEDFAREYFQLFFGINGTVNPQVHETVNIKNMSMALTDINPMPDKTLESHIVTFGTERHYPYTLEILNATNFGTTALERIEQLSAVAITHEESLSNLPVMIVSGLADDNLDQADAARLRTIWASMGEKKLLPFLRGYAISTMFHSERRVKYLSSVERNFLIANKIMYNNTQVYDKTFPINNYQREDIWLFGPEHDVFGGQTGVEASVSASVFRNNYNTATGFSYFYHASSDEHINKARYLDWSSVIRPDDGGEYRVRNVAEWLWQRFMADGLKNFGLLERAHLYALLATGNDLVYLAYPEQLDTVITTQDLETDSQLIALLSELETRSLGFESPDERLRQAANAGVGQAINFIIATPYIFAQEGK